MNIFRCKSKESSKNQKKKYCFVIVNVMFNSAIYYLMKVILKKLQAAELPLENNLLQISKNVSILIAFCFEFEFFYAHSGSSFP